VGIARRAPFPYGMNALTHLLRTVHFGSWGLTLNKSGMLEVFSYPGLRIFAVSGVGGGSHSWFGLLVEPHDPAYWRDRHPNLNPAEVEKYYEKIRSDMGAVLFSQDLWLRHSIWTHLPISPTGRCLPADPQPYLAIKLPCSESEVGQVTEGEDGVKRQTCAFDGDGLLGSRGGAKASVDFIYLAPVLNKGATVRDMTEVTRIVRDSGTAEYAVHFFDLRASWRSTSPIRDRYQCS
jgi:cholesterol oxidase